MAADERTLLIYSMLNDFIIRSEGAIKAFEPERISMQVTSRVEELDNHSTFQRQVNSGRVNDIHGVL